MQTTQMTTGTTVALIANLLTAFAGAILTGTTDWATMLGAAGAGWLLFAVGGLNVLAHAITGPPGDWTKGEWTSAIANGALALVGFLQGADWIHLVGPQLASWITAGVALVNTALHSFTGPPSR